MYILYVLKDKKKFFFHILTKFQIFKQYIICTGILIRKYRYYAEGKSDRKQSIHITHIKRVLNTIIDLRKHYIAKYIFL